MTPVSAWGLLDIAYHQFTVEHHLRLRTMVATAVGGLYQFAIGGGSKTVDGAARDVANLMKPFFTSTGAIDSYTFYHDSSGVLLPLQTASLAIAGTGTGTPVMASEATWSFRTVLFNKMRFSLFDGIIGAPPAKTGSLSSGTAYDFMAAVLSHVSLDPGNWIEGRDGTAPVTLVSYSRTFNRKMVRRYGL